MKTIRTFFINSVKLIFVLAVTCCSNTTQKHICDKALVEANLPKLTSQDIIYHEQYAYGVLLDSSVLNKIKKGDSCAICDLYKTLIKGKTVLPIHLALTALQTPEKISLEHYEFVEGETMDSARYVLNNLTWTRPINSYSEEVICPSDLTRIQKYWSKILLSKDKCTRYIKSPRSFKSSP